MNLAIVGTVKCPALAKTSGRGRPSVTDPTNIVNFPERCAGKMATYCSKPASGGAVLHGARSYGARGYSFEFRWRAKTPRAHPLRNVPDRTQAIPAPPSGAGNTRHERYR